MPVTEYNSSTNSYETTQVEDGKIIISGKANIEWLIDQNKRKIDSGVNGFNQSGNIRQIAELDMDTVVRLKTEHGIDVWNPDHMDALKKWLRNPENKYFRTVHGKF